MHKEHRVATEKMAMTSLLIQEGSWKLWPLERTLATMDATRADVEDTISFDRHITLWVCLPRRRRCFMASELKYASDIKSIRWLALKSTHEKTNGANNAQGTEDYH